MDVKRQADRSSAVTGAAGTSTAGTGAAGTACWCGAVVFEPLRADYGRCGDCGTVVFTGPYDAAEHASAGPAGFYGDRYWKEHVPARLGLPGLEERARSDLPERDAFYLGRILERLGPGARVLELGCGAGSLTYLLEVAGFDATGVELGPAAIELARRRFGVEVVRGPLEEAPVEGPFDAVVAIDLLEHLPAPAATLEQCARRLAPGGLAFLQTPCYRGEGAEWKMLIPREHLFLFTAASVERLLAGAGFAAVEVGDSLFLHDMWVVASRGAPPAPRPEPSAGVPPIAVALLDAYAEATRRRADRDAVDADRRAKQAAVDGLARELESVRADQRRKDALLRELDAELREVRGDQQRKAELIDRVTAELEEVRGDQSAKSELIDRVTAELEEVRGDRSAKGELIAGLTAELEEVRGDRSAKGELIARLTAELEEVRGDQSAKEELIAGLAAELEEVRGDQAAKEGVIARLAAELEEVRGDQAAKEGVIARLAAELETVGSELERARAELERARAELQRIGEDRAYRALQALRARLGRLRR